MSPGTDGGDAIEALFTSPGGIALSWSLMDGRGGSGEEQSGFT